MSNPVDRDTQSRNAAPARRAHEEKQAAKLSRKPPSPGRDDTLDEDLERERLEPGLDAEGSGGAGADPAGHHEDSNSNT